MSYFNIDSSIVKIFQPSDNDPPVVGDIVDITMRGRVIGVIPGGGIGVETRPGSEPMYVNWRGQETVSIYAYRADT